jgi:NADPH-dependent glutamate synthase beta subunit-like oxidoreductase/NAD-dependent dihydropyrimidine dehydrogenase PreA subunit
MTCNVNDITNKLVALIESGELDNAWCRQRAVELWHLLDDIHSGRAEDRHFAAMESVVRQLGEGSHRSCRDTVRLVSPILAACREEFLSHIESRNCPTGDCTRLSPAPCQLACPAGIDVASYVALIAQGRDAEAIELIRRDNPFPWVCGLVCPSPCEHSCLRGRIDQPVAIKALKRFAAESAMQAGSYRCPVKAPDNGRKVCIIGAGPAGLSAAYYLALRGFRVSIVESLPMAGGMMVVGIPRYRLPREVIKREVRLIRELGVEFRFNTRFGRDVSIDGLRGEGFQAFLLATGAHVPVDLKIPGQKTYGPVLAAIDWLRDLELGKAPVPGKKIAVIGGGNVAIDAARTALRLGCGDITIVYRRTRPEMPAMAEEITQAEEEGIRFSFLTMPLEIVGSGGKIKALRCLKTRPGPEDIGGRRRPVPVKGSEFVMPVDGIVTAIGQRTNTGDLVSLKKLNWAGHGTVTTDQSTMETCLEGVFAAGDLTTGPASVIEAVAGGKKAARGIERYFECPASSPTSVPVRRAREKCMELSAHTKMALQRPTMPTLDMAQRQTGFLPVELGYPEGPARNEAGRCLRCDICSRCGNCVAVCREKMGIDALKLGYMDPEGDKFSDFNRVADRCIGCGACAESCPTGAMQIEDRNGERVLRLCGTILSRNKLEYCEACGAVLGTTGFRKYLNGSEGARETGAGIRRLCPACARQMAASRVAQRYVPGIGR